jgi:CO/xanthine dehydrogenase Mo-binding subunit
VRQPPTVTWSYAVHVAIIEINRETGRVSIDKYAVAHDLGVVVNPMLVEGQVMGGTAQGLGGILCEAILYDSNGQLLTGSLMDYALPTASDITLACVDGRVCIACLVTLPSALLSGLKASSTAKAPVRKIPSIG